MRGRPHIMAPALPEQTGPRRADPGDSCAGGRGVHVSALEHPMVLAALARMASSGAWQRIIDERPLSEEVDVADAEFLVAAGAVKRVSDNDTFGLALTEPTYRDPPGRRGLGAVRAAPSARARFGVGSRVG